jgi:hypothetical protein
MIKQEIFYPRIGSGILFRADKLEHSSETSYKTKRAITFLFNVKAVPLTDDLEGADNTLPVIKNVEMSDDMQKDALDFT